MNKVRPIIIDDVEIMTDLTAVEIANLSKINAELQQTIKDTTQTIKDMMDGTFIKDNTQYWVSEQFNERAKILLEKLGDKE